MPTYRLCLRRQSHVVTSADDATNVQMMMMMMMTSDYWGQSVSKSDRHCTSSIVCLSAIYLSFLFIAFEVRDIAVEVVGASSSDYASWSHGILAENETSGVVLQCWTDNSSRILVELAADSANLDTAEADTQHYDGRDGYPI